MAFREFPEGLDMVVDVMVDDSGRVNLPARLREKYGIKKGDTVKMRAASSGGVWLITLART